jgi:hypothetical protein
MVRVVCSVQLLIAWLAQFDAHIWAGSFNHMHHSIILPDQRRPLRRGLDQWKTYADSGGPHLNQGRYLSFLHSYLLFRCTVLSYNVCLSHHFHLPKTLILSVHSFLEIGLYFPI